MKSFTGVRGDSLNNRIKPGSARIYTSQQRRTIRKSQGQVLVASKKLIDEIYQRKLSNLSNKFTNNTNLSARIPNKAFLITKRPPLPSKVSKQRTAQQIMISKYSDKVKLIYYSEFLAGERQGKFVIISGDFIINQDCFWKQDGINTGIAKEWKVLHLKFIVFWTIRKQSSLQKIKNFCALYQLPLNAVYLIKRRGNYSVNYSPILQDIQNWNRQTSHTTSVKQSCQLFQQDELSQSGYPAALVAVIQSVKMNTKDVCDFETYKGRVPIAINRQLAVGLIRIQQSGQGLHNIISICSGLLRIKKQTSLKLVANKKERKGYKMTSIPCFLAQYFNKKRSEYFKQIKQLHIDQNDKNWVNVTVQSGRQIKKLQFKGKNNSYNISTALNSEQDEQLEKKAEKHIDQFKRDLIKSILNSKGREFKIQGMSLQYYIGDMVKRNYKALIARNMDIKQVKVKPQLTSKCKIQRQQKQMQGNSYQQNQISSLNKIEYYQFYL